MKCVSESATMVSRVAPRVQRRIAFRENPPAPPLTALERHVEFPMTSSACQPFSSTNPPPLGGPMTKRIRRKDLLSGCSDIGPGDGLDPRLERPEGGPS